MTGWIKYIKFCSVFIASLLLFGYTVKCSDKLKLSNQNSVSDHNPNNFGSENVEPLSVIPSITTKSHNAIESQEISPAEFKKISDNIEKFASDENIDSYLSLKSESENIRKHLEKAYQDEFQNNDFSKHDHPSSETNFVAVFDEINSNKLEELLRIDVVDEVTTYTKAKDDLQSEKLSDQDNDSNTSKYDNILLSLSSSACQRESNPLTFQKCKASYKSDDHTLNLNYFGHGDFIKVDSNGKIIRDDFIIISDDDHQNSQEIDEYDDSNIIVEHIEYDYNGPRLPDCSDKIEIRDPVLIVSTIDGQISGINYETGEVIWSHSTNSEREPMLSSSMSKLEVSSRGEWVRLIPSLDGGIYRFDGEHVEALPVNADTFLHSSFKFSEDTIFSGGKFLEILGIHPHTGEIKYMCGKNGCPSNPSAGDNRQTLVVRRISYTVRAIDPSAGMERWNFSVGRHEVNLATGDCESLVKDVDAESLPFLHFILPEGNIFAVNKNSKVLWQQKLPSPILSAWSLINEELEQINLFNSTSIPALVPNDKLEEDSVDGKREPSLYVGIHRGQLYVQENSNLQEEFGSVVQRFLNSKHSGQGFSKVQWQPYLATAVSRTPVIHNGAKNHPLLLDYDKKQQSNELVVRHTYDYPFDNGYYLFGDDFDIVLNESDHWITSDNVDEIPPISESFMQQVYYRIVGGGVSFWGIISTIVIICILNLYFVWCIIYRTTRRAINDLPLELVAYILHNIFRENAQIFFILQRLGVNIAPLPPPPAPPIPTDPPALPQEAGEEEQSSAVETQRQDSSFSSRYTNDFEPICRLGKGGFGVVFQVKNKLDQNEYAVKRILLPSKESSAERVKREARALAKLNHTNIVRYYNSWLEMTPVGWEEEADSWWKQSEALSQSLEDDEYTEEPFSENTENLGVQTRGQLQLRVNREDSLSAVVNKLNYNSELQIQQLDSNDNKKSPLNDDRSHAFESDDDNDEKEEDSDEEEEGNDEEEEDSDEEPCLSNSNNCDDSSSSIVFEDTDSAQVHENTIPSANKNTLESDNNIITRNDYSKLTCKTRESSYSDSIVFKSNSGESIQDDSNVKSKTGESSVNNSIEFANRTRGSTHSDSIIFANRTKDSSNSNFIEFANSSGGEKNEEIKRGKSRSFCLVESRQSLKRRRLYTHTGLTDSQQRPSSLVLKDYNSSSVNKKNNEATENKQSSPSPRTYLYIQMELCHSKSLKEWLSSNKVRDAKWLYSIFNDIVHAVEYVHDRYLMHRDLKPSNIFFSLDGDIKIGDFGLVTTIEDENDAVTPMTENSSNPHNNILGQQQKTRNVGTTLYMSPEQFSGQSYTYKVDIFSLGLIFFEMLMPFSTEMERINVMEKARDKKFPTEFLKTYPDVENLLQLTLHGNPNERPTTRGMRVRKPLQSFQKDLSSIFPEEHFNLIRPKGHIRTGSGSFNFLHSTSVST